MNDDYAALAPIYERIGMSNFAANITPQLILYAQANDWLGRRVVDLGTGTGVSARWLANRGYNTTAIDSSLPMLESARQAFSGEGLGLRWLHGDIRALNDLHDLDLALAVDTFNELNSLRELEGVFASVYRCLNPGKLLIFDLHTIEGLAKNGAANEFVYDSDELVVFAANRFDYERLASVSEYTIFERSGHAWQRASSVRTRRGFPIQVVSALLTRTGFGIMALLDDQLSPVDVASTQAARVVFFAQKPDKTSG